MFISSAITMVVILGSPNSLNSRRDSSRMRSRVRRGAFWSMAEGGCFFSRKHNTETGTDERRRRWHQAALAALFFAAGLRAAGFFAAGLTALFFAATAFLAAGLAAGALPPRAAT